MRDRRQSKSEHTLKENSTSSIFSASAPCVNTSNIVLEKHEQGETVKIENSKKDESTSIQI